ncbi:MAG: cyclic nucleotide-binding domain-containing protein [Candidatus Latescibacteria bacterium]|nr:cyclic nucleotide-binding domain-containing protein [Candidatus Latescibacterota bacterium]
MQHVDVLTQESEKAMDDAAKRRLLDIISKIPLFKDLTLYQMEKVLDICRSRRYEVDQVIFDQGTQSLEMFVLLSGELEVLRDNALIAAITPVAPVGEMGILTGESRTASVVAKEPSSLFVIRRVDLDLLMKRDLDIAMVVLKNFSQTLSLRLGDSDAALEKQRHQVQEFKRQITEYKRRVDVLEQQVTELNHQIEMKDQRIKELEEGKVVGEEVERGAVAVGPSVVKGAPPEPSRPVDREVIEQLIERHLAMLEAKDYRNAYENLSMEAQHDVPWKEYEFIQQQVEELGAAQRIVRQRFELQHDEDLEYYYVKYTVDFASTSGILELYLQREDGVWKISHEVVTAAGKSHTV